MDLLTELVDGGGWGVGLASGAGGRGAQPRGRAVERLGELLDGGTEGKGVASEPWEGGGGRRRASELLGELLDCLASFWMEPERRWFYDEGWWEGAVALLERTTAWREPKGERGIRKGSRGVLGGGDSAGGRSMESYWWARGRYLGLASCWRVGGPWN